MKAPIAEKIKKELTTHGHTRVDNYYWLNDREDKKVIDYLNSENEYTENMLADTKKFQEDLFNEMKGRVKEKDESVPYKYNGYYYYSRYEEGSEYPIHARKKDSLDAEEEIILNLPQMAEGHSFYELGTYSISPDNKIIAYSIDTVSRRMYTIKFKNLETGEEYTDEIENTRDTIVWAEDNKTIFYTSIDTETLREDKIFKHVLDTDSKDDKLIFFEEDDTFGVGVYKSKSEKYIEICSYSTLTYEYRYLESDNPEGEFKVFAERTREIEYHVDHYQDKFYIRTNMDAENFRLMVTDIDKTEKENWKEYIPHREDVLLEDAEFFDGFLVLTERKEGLICLRVINLETGEDYYVDFGEPAYMAYTRNNEEIDSKVLRFGYTSMTTPSSVFDYDMTTKEKTLLKEQEVLGGFNKSEYVTERVYAKASDGVKVPISIVYKKGMVKNGENPTLLYAYGSYGASMDAYFSAVRLSLLDRGFVYALAHIRGGEEMGRWWYEDGKLLKKKNTFTDFIDCGKFLVEEKFTNSSKLFAMGGSAGGLLMGAVANMAPELFKGMIAAVPFVDVVTTMLDTSIPLTTYEYDEWGNPNDKEYYDYMLSYSPYDNVKAKNYPALLVTTGLHDSQVQYWEPAKWVAKLRDMKTDDNMLLLHTNMETGHGGASGRFEVYKEVALEYAFMFNLLGIKE